jgi:hypothetical protein
MAKLIVSAALKAGYCTSNPQPVIQKEIQQKGEISLQIS